MTFHILETNNMSNTEATLDGRKCVGFLNKIKLASSKVSPSCRDTLHRRVVASLGSVSQLSPSPGDFSLISLVPPQVGKAARLSHLQENFVFNINLGGPGFEFVEGVSKHLDPET